MPLPDACEPFFQQVCLLNRSARKSGTSGSIDAAQVRADLLASLEEVRGRVQAQPALSGDFEAVEPALLYFADFTVRSSALPFSKSWRDLAAERGMVGGDEDFYDRLDALLADKSEPASRRLWVYYTCLGLGFTGWFTGQPDVLRKKMAEISPRIRAGGFLDNDPKGRICPEAYEHVNTSDLIEPPSRTLIALGLALGVLGLTVLAANAAVFLQRHGELADALDQIIAKDPSPPPPAAKK